jgi:hypothetical protein
MDMHSGGGSKEDFEYLYVEASEDEAKAIFYNRFGHNPERVSCTCCGDDYSISSGDDLAQLTGYDRNCDWPKGAKGYVETPRPNKYGDERPVIPLEDYLKSDGVRVIRAGEIKPEERVGSVPTEGYVWL